MARGSPPSPIGEEVMCEELKAVGLAGPGVRSCLCDLDQLFDLFSGLFSPVK